MQLSGEKLADSDETDVFRLRKSVGSNPALVAYVKFMMMESNK